MSAQTVAPPTVQIEVDGQPVTARKGEMIIQVTDRLGISVPRFCYHPKLPIAANCRMCLVDVEKMPKPQPACATPVLDGMKIYTQSRRAIDSQRNVMEFLLINHPLDCPICDQGGECELQDVAMGYGRSVSRYSERKRVVADEDLGPLVSTDMTRCIHCTRCVRFLDVVAGSRELGGMGRGEGMEISTYIGRSLESELQGNIIDVCPVGALTNKPYRFRARAWELQARAHYARHDALMSNLFLHVRRGEILRIVPRDAEQLNESWLADRDRFSFQGLYASDRARYPEIRDGDHWRRVGWEEALNYAVELLAMHRGDGLGALVSPRASNEEGLLLAQLVRGLGSPHIDHRLRSLDPGGDVAEPWAISLATLEKSDFLLWLGGNPRHEVPLLNHRLRKAALAGAQILLINARVYDGNLPGARQRLVRPSEYLSNLLGIAKALVKRGIPAPTDSWLADLLADAPEDAQLHETAEQLQNAASAVLIRGRQACELPDARAIGDVLDWIAAVTGARHVAVPAANACGLVRSGVLPGPRGLSAVEQIQQPRRGYLCFNFEPEHDHALGIRAREVLANADTIALTAFAGESVRSYAKVILPIAEAFEDQGSALAIDGSVVAADAGARAPEEARSAWRVLRMLGARLNVAGFDFVDFKAISQFEPPQPALIQPARILPTPVAGLERLADVAIYQADSLVRRASALQATPINEAYVRISAADRVALGLAEEGRCRVRTATTAVEIDYVVDAGLVAGVVDWPHGVGDVPIEAAAKLILEAL